MVLQVSLLLILKLTNHLPGLNANFPELGDKITLWNSNLTAFAQKFSDKHRDAYVEIYDSAWLMDEVMDNPERYGFVDLTIMCNTGECILGDAFHPSYAFQRILAQDMALSLDSFEKRFWAWRDKMAFKTEAQSIEH